MIALSPKSPRDRSAPLSLSLCQPCSVVRAWSHPMTRRSVGSRFRKAKRDRVFMRVAACLRAIPRLYRDRVATTDRVARDFVHDARTRRRSANLFIRVYESTRGEYSYLCGLSHVRRSRKRAITSTIRYIPGVLRVQQLYTKMRHGFHARSDAQSLGCRQHRPDFVIGREREANYRRVAVFISRQIARQDSTLATDEPMKPSENSGSTEEQGDSRTGSSIVATITIITPVIASVSVRQIRDTYARYDKRRLAIDSCRR